MRRDLADFWNLLWELALGAAALFLMLDALAPPEHLFWKPLDLERPIGQATARQVRDFDIPRTAAPPLIEQTTQECMATLRAAGVQVERAEDTDDGGFCVVQGAVRITGGAVTPLRPGGVVMQCPLAIRYVIWDRQVLQPLARSRYGSPPAAVDNMGTYSCRRIYGSQSDGDRPSEHARANALDVAGVTLADGRQVSVLADWDGDGPAGRDGQAFIRAARDGACRLFGVVLSPDYNEAHRDHLHLDGAPYSLCR
ncbi:extensin family protein [Brevundimonas sp.]|uniref:extensin-like domain-containing protein n=1 Tax=Brevundimonas sp. TaxID=1871086 RepID=UPI0035B07340